MELGIKGHAETVVTYDNTAAKIGSGDQEVFATPWMIALMEEAAQGSVLPYLDEGQATVGTSLQVTHDAATPIGMKVWADSELIGIEGRKLIFRVEAFDECGSIGKGRMSALSSILKNLCPVSFPKDRNSEKHRRCSFAQRRYSFYFSISAISVDSRGSNFIPYQCDGSSLVSLIQRSV